MIWALFCTMLFAVLPACSPHTEIKTLIAVSWLVIVSIFALGDFDDKDR